MAACSERRKEFVADGTIAEDTRRKGMTRGKSPEPTI
jgi:hypothetical protein